MNYCKLLFLALVTIVAASCSKTKDSNIQVTDFLQVTVFTPYVDGEKPEALICDSLATASIVQYDTTVLAVTLKGGVFGDPQTRYFDIQRNQNLSSNVNILKDRISGEDAFLYKLRLKDTKEPVWFLETSRGVARFSNTPLSCDEY